MSKLYFRYGCMNSSKTANLLMVAYNYERTGRNVLLFKPSIDTRYDEKYIISRVGLKRKVDYLIDKDENNFYFKINRKFLNNKNYDCILVDEANLLSTKIINDLKKLTKFVPVICYGLKTDYKSKLFEGSKRLLEISDSIEEIKTICNLCNKKAIINGKHYKNRLIKKGDKVIDIGGNEKYISLCWNCWDRIDHLGEIKIN